MSSERRKLQIDAVLRQARTVIEHAEMLKKSIADDAAAHRYGRPVYLRIIPDTKHESLVLFINNDGDGYKRIQLPMPAKLARRLVEAGFAKDVPRTAPEPYHDIHIHGAPTQKLLESLRAMQPQLQRQITEALRKVMSEPRASTGRLTPRTVKKRHKAKPRRAK